MKENYRKLILPLLIIILLVAIGEGVYIYSQNKSSLSNNSQNQKDYSKIVPSYNPYLEVQDKSIIERNLRILNCSTYALTRPLVYPMGRANGEIYNQSLICDENHGKVMLIDNLSKVEILRELYMEGNALSLIANPKNGNVLIFGSVFPEGGMGVGQLYSFSKKDLSFSKLNNSKIRWGKTSPDQDKTINLTDKEISICNFLTDTCKVYVSLPNGESLTSHGQKDSLPTYNVAWLTNNKIEYKVYYENDFTDESLSRKEKVSRVIDLD